MAPPELKAELHRKLIESATLRARQYGQSEYDLRRTVVRTSRESAGRAGS